jgi:hypothetical protein
MEYRGIAYEIKMGLERQWAWIVHTPNQKKGACMGERARADAAAKIAIDKFHRRNTSQQRSRRRSGDAPLFLQFGRRT